MKNIILLAMVIIGCSTATVAEARLPRCRVACEASVVECRRPCYRPVYVPTYRCPPPVVVQQPCYVEQVYIAEPCYCEQVVIYNRPVVYRQPSCGFSFTWIFR